MSNLNPMDHDPTPEAVHELVQICKIRHDISQNEVARRIGVSARTMRSWLAGERSIPYTAQFTLEWMSCN